jgi:outer membrane protein TolC
VWVLSAALLSQTVAAGEHLTLAQAVSEGLGESPIVAGAEAQKKLAAWQKISALTYVLPKASAFATHYFSAKYETLPFEAGPISAEVPIAYPKTSYGLEMRWTLFDGLAGPKRTEAAYINYQAADAAAERRHFEVRKKIELQYFAVLAAGELREVALRNLKTIQDSLVIAEARVKNGISTAPDVLRVQVQKTEAEAEVQRTGDTIVIQRQRLRQLMGRASDERVLEGKLPEPSDRERVSQLVFAGVTERDDIRAIELQAQAAAKLRTAGYGELWPSVSLVGHIENYDNTDYAVSKSNSNYRSAYGIGLALKWDILDAATLAKPGIASAEFEVAESQRKEAVLNAPTDFELWKRRYIYSSDLYQARLNDIKRADESLRIIHLSFQQGRRIINEVLDAEVDLFRARAGAVQSLFEATEARNQLELVLGKDLK